MSTPRTHKPLFLTPLLALIAAACFAQPAAAASQRFASPSGSGVACTAASPCDILTAVDQATAGDDVTLASGTYTLGVTLTDPAEITIHGVAGKVRPQLMFLGSTQAGLSLPNGSTVRDVEIDQQYPDRLAIDGTYPVLDQLVVRNPSSGACSVSVVGGTITNSIVVAGGTAVCSDVLNAPSTSSLRNVTAISTDAGTPAVEAVAQGAGGISTMVLTNVIARGGTNAAGLRAWTDGSGAHALISDNHTNSSGSATVGTNAQVADGAGNQTTPPTFVDAAAGNYREAAGSVTIDAGLTQQANGTQDVDGDSRVVGKSTDIGADEFVPPSPAQPGQTGQPGQPGQPGSTMTSTSSTSTTPGTHTSHGASFGGVKLLSTRLSFARRAIIVSLRCPVGTPGRCSGQTTLTTRVRVKHTRRTVTVVLGRARFSIAAGAQRKITIKLSRAGGRLFARVHRVSGRDTNAARNSAGQSKTTVAAVTIRRLAVRHRR